MPRAQVQPKFVPGLRPSRSASTAQRRSSPARPSRADSRGRVVWPNPVDCSTALAIRDKALSDRDFLRLAGLTKRQAVAGYIATAQQSQDEGPSFLAGRYGYTPAPEAKVQPVERRDVSPAQLTGVERALGDLARRTGKMMTLSGGRPSAAAWRPGRVTEGPDPGRDASGDAARGAGMVVTTLRVVSRHTGSVPRASRRVE